MKHLTYILLLAFIAPFGWGEDATTTFFCEAKSRAQSKAGGETFQFPLSLKVQVEIDKDHAVLTWEGVSSNPKVSVNRYIVTGYLNEGQYFAVTARMERDDTRLFTIRRDFDGEYLAAEGGFSGGYASFLSLDCTKF